MLIHTEVEIEHTITEDVGYAPCTIMPKQVAWFRPHVNDDCKYEGTSVYFTNGNSCIIKMQYEEFKGEMLSAHLNGHLK